MNLRNEFRKPEWVSDWKIFILFAAISFCFAFGLRAMELPKWDNPAFMVDGEYIMGTHDAYYWLAGAKGVGSAADNPMSEVLRFLGSITGSTYGNIAFWLPAVFAGFTAVAAFAWGMLVGGPWVGLAGAVFATSVPAFYFRTRLSYYDTDVVTLFFPLLISVLVAGWVFQGTRKGWLKSGNNQNDFNPLGWDYLLLVIAGLATLYGSLWHGNVPIFSFAVLVIALGVSLLCGNKQTRPTLLRGLVFFALSFLPEFWGVCVGIFLCVLGSFSVIREHRLYRSVYVYLAIITVILISTGAAQSLLTAVNINIEAYLKPVSDAVEVASSPKYPGIAQSVIEAQNISYKALFSLLIGSEFLGWLGFIGFAVLVLLRPYALFLSPFLIASMGAVYLGGRFAMFGGIVFGIGIVFAGQQILNRFLPMGKRPIAVAILSILSVMFLMVSNGRLYAYSAVTSIMTQDHAKALIVSGKHIPKNSTLWTWWDWGYASMYFAETNAFANGGHHSGPILFPLGLAYATPSFKQANQIIKFSAACGNAPAAELSKASGHEAQQFIDSLAVNNYSFGNIPKQYIVACWENIRLSYWILYYGSWNLQTGMSVHPQVAEITSPFELDFSSGLFTPRGQTPLQLRSYDFFEKGQRVSQVIPGVVGPHLLYNKLANSGFLTGDAIYSSMLLRLLIDDPKGSELSKYFRLVYEGYPSVRVYEVL